MTFDSPNRKTPNLEHLTLAINGVELHVAEAKPKDCTVDTPLVLCLHGFPEYWGAWHRQLPALLDAGYRVWMPDLRGYNLSGCPPKTADYRMSVLRQDIRALIEASNAQRCMLVAHDWGAAIAWCAAAAFPNLIEKLVIANVPHPRVFRRTVFTSMRQFIASWYIFFFQIPFLPDWLLSRDQFKALAKTMIQTANSGTFTDSDMASYRRAWRNSGVTPMIRYYRAALRYQDLPSATPISVPTLILWGKNDVALTHQMATASLKYCLNAKLKFFDDATHWVQHDAVEQFNEEMITFLRSDI